MRLLSDVLYRIKLVQWRNGVRTGYVVLATASTRQGRTRKQSVRRRGGRALRSIASRNGPFGLCQTESFGNSFLARIIHERFCCNRQSAVTTSLRPAGSPLAPSPYCTSTPRILTAPRAGLATRLSDFTTNRHEYYGLDSVSFRLPSWQNLDGHPVPPANCAIVATW